MLPLYNQELWVSMKAGITASTGASATSVVCHYSKGSSAAMTVLTATAGGELSYMAYDPPTNEIHIMYIVSS